MLTVDGSVSPWAADPGSHLEWREHLHDRAQDVELVGELYVAPTERSQGLGAQLVEASRAEAARRGADIMEINVDEADVDAQRFYARAGFTMINSDTGERAFYWTGSTGRSGMSS